MKKKKSTKEVDSTTLEVDSTTPTPSPSSDNSVSMVSSNKSKKKVIFKSNSVVANMKVNPLHFGGTFTTRE